MTQAPEAFEATICSKTGYALVRSPRVPTFRISRYGAINPLARVRLREAQSWGRFDTLGKTIYSADDRTTAYLEILASYRVEINGVRRGVASMARAAGRDPDEFWASVLADWDRDGHRDYAWLPSTFRTGRTLYSIGYDDGWWIDASHRSTLSALMSLGRTWPGMFGASHTTVTTASLTGDDRVLTTSIAQHLREDAVLEDGTRPLGVRYASKYGASSAEQDYCWAYWLREGRDKVARTPTSDVGQQIAADDAAFLEAQRLCGIRVD